MRGIWDNCKKEGYEYEITNAFFHEDEGKLVIETRSNFVVELEERLHKEHLIKSSNENINTVDFLFEYENIIQGEEEFLPIFIEIYFNQREKELDYLIKTISLGNSSFSKDKIIINLVGETFANTLNSNEKPLIEAKIFELFGLNIEILFESCSVKRKEIEKNIEKEILEAETKINKVPIKENSVEKENKKISKKEIKGDVLHGKNFTGEYNNFSNIKEGMKDFIAKGEAFKVDVKDLPPKVFRGKERKSSIITLLISDGETSICGNFFADSDMANDIKGRLKSNPNIMAKGEILMDPYARGLVLKIKHLKVTEKPKGRIDNYPQKRVELHAHTKMSTMDAVNEPEEFVKLAASWGHKAIAITDHGGVQAFPEVNNAAKSSGIKALYGMEGYLLNDDGLISEDGKIDYKGRNTNHIIIFAKNKVGLKNLYKLVSLSHINYFYRKPRIPKSILKENIEGLIIGSACEAGEVFRAILKEYLEEQNNGRVSQKTHEETLKVCDLYDYFEIMPLINNDYLTRNIKDSNGHIKRMKTVEGYKDLENLNKRIVALGEELGKPVVATCDAHYTNKEDNIYRNILLASLKFDDLGAGGLYFRTTEEMLEEFQYLGEEKAREVVIDNTVKIADMIEEMEPVPKGKFPPHIENSDEILRNSCYEKAHSIYGQPLPKEIEERLEEELGAIINEGYAVMYVSAKMLVNKSMEDGYLVGSRGSVGSSFAATMAGITEVNPLPPHYICPKCKNLIWGDGSKYDCGVDMEPKKCPTCHEDMNREGFTIPFETFLGIPGKIKEPDIDLNFAGEYQGTAHKYVDEIFGSENVFKAGTIGTLAEKTAFGCVKSYCMERHDSKNKYEQERISQGIKGVKKSTGQHPGGIIIVPRGHEIYEFCPVQRPANKMNCDTITTHFDYHAIDQNLLKLDILGHDVPSIIRHLQDMTGVDPMNVPLHDEKVAQIFLGTESLDIKVDDYRFRHGSYGIPEFGTDFVRKMLDDVKPTKFADLLRISGFSHGTDVWKNNAQDYIKSNIATIENAISTRDDIMNYLIGKGVPSIPAFTIMEKVRKGKGVTEEEEALMKENDVPQWYVDSCRKIKYMFPRAHAVAYVIMAYRIAYFKVYYPAEFYAATLTAKIDSFNWTIAKLGIDTVYRKMEETKALGYEADEKAKQEAVVFELVYEMLARGIEFVKPDLYMSKSREFYAKNGKVVVPLQGIKGVGENCAREIKASLSNGEFSSIEDFAKRTRTNKTNMDILRQEGIFNGLDESDQLTLF